MNDKINSSIQLNTCRVHGQKNIGIKYLTLEKNEKRRKRRQKTFCLKWIFFVTREFKRMYCVHCLFSVLSIIHLIVSVFTVQYEEQGE